MPTLAAVALALAVTWLVAPYFQSPRTSLSKGPRLEAPSTTALPFTCEAFFHIVAASYEDQRPVTVTTELRPGPPRPV